VDAIDRKILAELTTSPLPGLRRLLRGAPAAGRAGAWSGGRDRSGGDGFLRPAWFDADRRRSKGVMIVVLSRRLRAGRRPGGRRHPVRRGRPAVVPDHEPEDGAGAPRRQPAVHTRRGALHRDGSTAVRPVDDQHLRPVPRAAAPPLPGRDDVAQRRRLRRGRGKVGQAPRGALAHGAGRAGRRPRRDDVDHATSALTLTWLWYELARHPEVEGRVLEECGRGVNAAWPRRAGRGPGGGARPGCR